MTRREFLAFVPLLPVIKDFNKKGLPILQFKDGNPVNFFDVTKDIKLGEPPQQVRAAFVWIKPEDAIPALSAWNWCKGKFKKNGALNNKTLVWGEIGIYAYILFKGKQKEYQIMVLSTPSTNRQPLLKKIP